MKVEGIHNPTPVPPVSPQRVIREGQGTFTEEAVNLDSERRQRREQHLPMREQIESEVVPTAEDGTTIKVEKAEESKPHGLDVVA